MKELTVHEVQEVSGGWFAAVGKEVGIALGGWLLGEYVFEPIRDHVVEWDRRWTERVLEDARRDPHRIWNDSHLYWGK